MSVQLLGVTGQQWTSLRVPDWTCFVPQHSSMAQHGHTSIDWLHTEKQWVHQQPWSWCCCRQLSWHLLLVARPTCSLSQIGTQVQYQKSCNDTFEGWTGGSIVNCIVMVHSNAWGRENKFKVRGPQ